MDHHPVTMNKANLGKYWSAMGSVLFGLLALSHSAVGEEFPIRPVRLIAPFPAGSGVDVVARLVGQKLTQDWRHQVIVDNRGGASGAIGAEIAAKATPDGYTLLMGNLATHAVNVNLFKNLAYDPVKDFAPVTLVARVSEVLVVPPSFPARTLGDLITLAKAKPGKLTYGSSGLGSSPQVETELLKLLAGIDMVHVPYKGSALAFADLFGARIDMYIGNPLTAVPHVRSGRLRALGVTGAKRSASLPDVPTIAEAGVPGYESYNWYGLFVPQKTPQRIVALLNSAVVKALRAEDVTGPLVRDGAEVVASSPDELAKFVLSEIRKIEKLAKRGALRVD